MSKRQIELNSKKKIIGIITFHRDINYGAYLQTDSLIRYIRKAGLSPVIIDYRNIYHEIFTILIQLKKIISSPNEIMLIYKNFRLFRKMQNSMPRSKVVFTKYSLKRLVKHDNYACVVYGSDEIWNIDNELYRGDTVYFGESVNTKKISYAVSSGNYTQKKFPKRYEYLLKDFSELSARDRKTAKLVSLAALTAKKVVDPTMLTKQYTNDHLSIVQRILIYATSLKKSDIEQIEEFARNNLLIVTTLVYKHPIDGTHVDNISPAKFIEYFSNSRYIIIGTYHGLVYAIKAKSNFAVTLPQEKHDKMSDLIMTYKIKNRIMNKRNLKSLFSNPPSKRLISKIYQNERNISIKYLSRILR